MFRQDFKNFQLNTFDGSVFIVQNVNGCRRAWTASIATTARPRAPRISSRRSSSRAVIQYQPGREYRRLPVGDVGYGVRSTGVELEASFSPMRDLRINLGFTYADTKYRNNLVGGDDGTPLNPALRELPGNNISNAPKTVRTGALALPRGLDRLGLSGLFYVDARVTGKYNTGSDLFPQKGQKGYSLVNGRIGIRGPDDSWALELWAQNLFNKNYAQVAFNSPFQQGGSTQPPYAAGFTHAPFIDPQFPGGRQLFSMFLGEPRTFGMTLRAKFGGRRVEPYVAPPAPPPPAPPPPATQTCADGSVIQATATCPVPPPPPPPPAPAPERGH